MPSPRHKNGVPATAFSLVEVVACLGIVTFCLMALLGLFVHGLNANRDSARTVTASHLMTGLITRRLASPTNTDVSIAGPIPPLDQAANSLSGTPIYLTHDGAVTSKSQADFQLNYQIILPASADNNTALSNVVRGAIFLSWPAAAPLTNASGFYEAGFCRAKP